MNLENVKALADILNTKGLSAIEVGEGENRIRIEKDSCKPVSPQTTKSPAQSAEAAPIVEPATTTTGESETKTVGSNNLTEVKSPLVGVYYAAPSPDAETFVSIGGKVKKGDILCIIETMKLMNEITAEHDGEIADICIKNGDIAEFGQVLFKILL